MSAEDSGNVSSGTYESDISALSAVHTSFGNGAKFTFRAPVVHKPVDLSNTVTDCNLKRPKGHPDGPTPANSPQKKCVRAPNTDRTLSPSLLFPSSSTAPASIGSDIFGSECDATDDSKSTSGTLFSFWQRETSQDRVERDNREFEELSTTREMRAFAQERDEAKRKVQRRVCDRERQQKRRDVVRNRKIAAGWEPNQKRVSYLSLIE
jgi:hypothetical protein